jgi:molecular chaperone DnaK
MDQIITDYVVDVFKKDTGSDPTSDKTAMIRIKEAAEKAKVELSSVVESEINLPYITYDQNGPKNLLVKLTRAKLDELVRPTVEKCRNSLMNSLSDAKLTPQDVDKILLIGGPTRMPIVRSFVESIMGRKPETGVDPMEAVAMGAAIQAGILSGEVRGDIVLLDVTPLTLGVEVLGGLTEPLIDRNTTIPTAKSKIFTTAADNQTVVTVNVVQGERTMAADNISLGSFNLGGIPPTARGIPQIEVTFDLDADGILNAAAKDLGTQKEAKITITASTKLAKDEIDKMKLNAEEHAEQDKVKREKVEIRNEAENLIYSTEKLLREQLKDKITDEQKQKLESAIKELKDVLDKDTETIKLKLDDLKRISSEVNAVLYQQTPRSGAKQWTYTTKETPSDKQSSE